MSRILYPVGFVIAYLGHWLAVVGIAIATQSVTEALSYSDWAYPLPVDEEDD